MFASLMAEQNRQQPCWGRSIGEEEEERLAARRQEPRGRGRRYPADAAVWCSHEPSSARCSTPAPIENLAQNDVADPAAGGRKARPVMRTCRRHRDKDLAEADGATPLYNAAQEAAAGRGARCSTPARTRASRRTAAGAPQTPAPRGHRSRSCVCRQKCRAADKDLAKNDGATPL